MWPTSCRSSDLRQAGDSPDHEQIFLKTKELWAQDFRRLQEVNRTESKKITEYLNWWFVAVVSNFPLNRTLQQCRASVLKMLSPSLSKFLFGVHVCCVFLKRSFNFQSYFAIRVLVKLITDHGRCASAGRAWTSTFIFKLHSSLSVLIVDSAIFWWMFLNQPVSFSTKQSGTPLFTTRDSLYTGSGRILINLWWYSY